MGRLVGSNEVAEEFGVSQSTVQRLAGKGEIPALRIGSRFKFNLPELRKLFESRARGERPR
jgi:excisionase family DNA binding protein